MKTILSAVLVCALVAVGSAEQLSSYKGAQNTTYTAGTNKVMALTTNGFFTMDVPKAAGDIAIYVNYKFLNAPGAGDRTGIDLELFRGIDVGVFETNAYLTWTITGNSTTSHSSMLTTNVNGIPYLRGRFKNYSTNSHATNVLVYYGFKN